jgi:hypothetical protein
MIAQSVTVDGTGTRLGGGVRLSSAKVGAHLLIGDGAHVAADPSTGWALDADPLSVAGDLFISGEGTRLAGGLRLNGATFGGSVAIYDGASVAAADDGWSIAADNLTVPQSLLFVQNVRLEGGLRMRASRVGQQLGINDAQIAGEVVLEGTHVAILKTRGARIDGLLDLSHARLGRLDDDPLGLATGPRRVAVGGHHPRSALRHPARPPDLVHRATHPVARGRPGALAAALLAGRRDLPPGRPPRRGSQGVDRRREGHLEQVASPLGRRDHRVRLPTVAGSHRRRRTRRSCMGTDRAARRCGLHPGVCPCRHQLPGRLPLPESRTPRTVMSAR